MLDNAAQNKCRVWVLKGKILGLPFEKLHEIVTVARPSLHPAHRIDIPC